MSLKSITFGIDNASREAIYVNNNNNKGVAGRDLRTQEQHRAGANHGVTPAEGRQNKHCGAVLAS